jgi:hypothetical protein
MGILGSVMNGIAWPLTGWVSRLLEGDEREAVLGDLLETNESSLRGFLDVFGLVFRRQIGLWKNPQPWLAGLVVTLPSSYLLTYVSLSVSCTYQRLVNHKIYGWHWPTGHEGFPLLLCHIFLLIAWSWSAGYIVGSVSRRTLWVSSALSVIPASFFMSMHPFAPLLRVCLFLFLLPAIFGARRGLLNICISLRSSFLLALTTTVAMISAWSNHALWDLNWILISLAWYLVAIAWRSGPGARGRNLLLLTAS